MCSLEYLEQSRRTGILLLGEAPNMSTNSKGWSKSVFLRQLSPRSLYWLIHEKSRAISQSRDGGAQEVYNTSI